MKEQFAWRHYYWILTDEGIAYLRAHLNLPDEVEPSTRERTRPALDGMSCDIRLGGGDHGKTDDSRGAYRTSDKTGEAGIGAAKPAFAGYGRGRPM